MQTAPTHHIEALEPRLAPAGIVTVSLSAQGQLTLTGDAESNNVHLTTNAEGLWSLSDTSDSGTLFRYQGADTATLDIPVPLRSIQTNLKGGADQLTLQNIALPGSLTIQDSEGSDRVTLTDNILHGPVKISTGIGEDTIQLRGNRISGALSIQSGLGGDQVHLGPGLYKDVSLHLGGTDAFGTDRLFLENTLDTAPVTILGDLRIQTSGSSDLQLSAPQLTILGDVTIQMSGNSITKTQFSAQDGHHTLIGGDLTYQGSNGDDEFHIGTYLSNDFTFTVAGTTSLSAGGGENYFSAGGTGQLTFSELEINTGKNLQLDFRAHDLSLSSLELRGKNSDLANIAFQATNLWIADDIDVKNVVKHNRNQGEEMGLSLNLSGTNVHVGGDISINNKKASTHFSFSAEDGSFGSLDFKGSKYSDIVLLHNTNGLTRSYGDIRLDFGKGALSQAEITGLSVLGDVSITSHTASRDLEPGAILSDDLIISRSTIFGKTTVTQNNTSVGTVHIVGSTFIGQLDINTGSGDDTVNFGNSTAYHPTVEGSENTFHALVRVQLGNGSDQLHLDPRSSPYQDSNTFLGNLQAFGGSGTNTLSYNATDDTFASAPLFQNFTTTLLT